MFDEKQYQKSYQKEWYKKNKALANERSRQFYLKNKDRILQTQRENYQHNKEKKSLYSKNYQAKNKDRMNGIRRKHYYANKDKILAQHKEYKKNNPEKAFNMYIKRKYGIDINLYKEMMIKQDFKCAICNNKLMINNKKLVHIDHNHKTNKIRKILCSRCNIFVGYFENGYRDLIEKTAAYIIEHEVNE